MFRFIKFKNSKYISIIKGFIIFTLVILTLVQTGRLWSRASSGYNPFNPFNPFIKATSSNIKKEYLSLITKPYRIIAGNNSGEFKAVCSNIEFLENGIPKKSTQKLAMDDALTMLFNDGEFVESNSLDWVYILCNMVMLAEYTFKMPTDIFCECYGSKSGLLTSKFSYFNSISFICSEDEELTKIIFINTEDNRYYEYRLKTGATRKVSEAILQMTSPQNSGVYEDSDDNLYYISSVLDGLDIFQGNVFIPKWKDGILRYKSITPINPYMENGNILYSTLEKKIDVFFENPVSKQPISLYLNDIYRFSDENTVVRYYPNGILEYDNFKTLDGSISSSFTSAFSSAIDFMENDSAIMRDYYLSGYVEPESGDVWTFYFDFTINNFPVMLSKKLNMNSAAVVTVSGDTVIKYKHYAYIYYLAEDSEVHGDMLGLTENQSEGLFYEPGSIREFTLVYRIDDSQIINLSWKMDIDGFISLEPAY